MHNRIKSIVLAFLLLVVFANSHAQNERLEVTLSQPGKAYSIDLSLVHGSIKVTGHNGKDVIIEPSSRDNTPPPPPAPGGMRKIGSGGGMNLKVREQDNKIKISSDFVSRPTDISLKVPENGTFILKTVNNGVIQIDNVSGEFELSNINGPVTLNNVSGTAVVNTINGNITASFARINPGTPMAFSTLNGKVDLSFPSTFKGNIKAKTDRGDVYSDFEVDLLKSETKTVKSGSNGYTKIETSDWISGRINGGGSEVMMKTTNGDIYIRKK